MKRLHLIILGTLLFALFPLIGMAATTFPKGSPAFSTNYAEAQKLSKESGKPLVVVFSANWCPPCRANKANVYPSEAVKPFHDKFVWVYLDTDDKANASVAQSFGVSGIPHIQFVDKDSKKLGQSIGGTTPAEFAKVLEGILKPKPAK